MFSSVISSLFKTVAQKFGHWVVSERHTIKNVIRFYHKSLSPKDFKILLLKLCTIRFSRFASFELKIINIILPVTCIKVRHVSGQFTSLF